ncbi:flagellar hook-length control protein FliK [uncultured Selenomonas sp.]|uniref:flagellar hook-length control protein FliK n=1 Tax=uncultured Selenomonas sp. TaxID=159275 RepID=UPI0028E6EF3B|nr:flagellar hook-length control protein FliK [uncultured Selenomonas sp.]
MNANNLMAVSTADGISAGAGAPKGRSSSVGNRAQTTSGKNSFSDTFGALQKGMGADAPKTEMREAPVKSAQTKVPQTESPASSQDTQDVTAKTPKVIAPQTNGTEKKMPTVDDAAVQSTAAAALTALVNTDAAFSDADVNEGLDAALTEILERYGLTADQLGDTKLKNAVQNLLQVLPENAAKSHNLLLALEGQPLTQENAASALDALAQKIGAEGLPTPVQNADASVLRLAALDASLSAQLRAAVNTEAPVVQEGMPAIAVDTLPAPTAAENAVQRSSVNTSVLATEQNTQMTAETVAAPLLRAQAEPVSSGTRSAAELVGNQLTVDADVDAANPLTVLAQRTMRHDTMQGDTTGQQSSAQEEQQPPANGQQDVRMASSTAFEIPSRTTETAPQPAQPIAAQTGTSPLPMQDVNAPAPAQETQHPQPDYEIPRQIVEQARLLRTLNDTQMVIRLHPEHLGELTLRVSVGSNGAVQASFHSDNAQVRNVIENSLVQLRQELNNQGLKIDRVGVYAGLADGQMPQGQGQEAWQQSSNRQSGAPQVYTRGDVDDYIDEVDGLASAATQERTDGSVGTDGVDYRV